MMTVGLCILAILGTIGFVFLVLIAMIPAVHFLIELLYKYDDWLEARRDKHGHDHHDPPASPFLDSAIKQHDAICVGNIHDNYEFLEGE